MPGPSEIQEGMMTDATEDTDDDDDDGPGFHTATSGPGREDMAAEYLAEQDDWPAKTVLDINDPARVAVLEQWEEIFPECEHHQDVYDGFLQTFLKSRTSVEGKSRNEFKAILQSMYGGSPDDSAGSMIVGALGEGLDDD